MKADKSSSLYKIYVGNLPSSTRISELKELFEKFGAVMQCDVLKDFGFIHMESKSDAKAAIAGLNDTQWKGVRIRVEMSTSTSGSNNSNKRNSHSASNGRSVRRPSPPPPSHRGGYQSYSHQA